MLLIRSQFTIAGMVVLSAWLIMTLLATAQINCSQVFALKHCGRHLTVNKYSLLHSWGKGVGRMLLHCFMDYVVHVLREQWNLKDGSLYLLSCLN